jgi:hypothetical protein
MGRRSGAQAKRTTAGYTATCSSRYGNLGANHVHTVWRDPRGDFADDVLAQHRADHGH